LNAIDSTRSSKYIATSKTMIVPAHSDLPLPPAAAIVPSFSIVIETENLASAEIDGLARCLATLSAQDLSPLQANEVLIVESGDVPPETIDRLCRDYPFLTIKRIDAGIDYYAAKMQGIALTTGEIIILADSDCVYEPTWLRNMLMPFAQQPEVLVVAGETTTPISDAYELAIALTYIFPRFSARVDLARAEAYFCNNVGFRREFVVSCPIPSQLPIYRGNCTIHARSIQAAGAAIWQQPQARATHAVPNGLAHFWWRFLLLGYDALAVARITRQSTLTSSPIRDLRLCAGIGIWKIEQVLHRCYPVFAEDPRRLANLPLAVPMAIVAMAAFLTGLVLAYVRPNYLRENASNIEVKWSHSQS
jgi:glycosyltransferase involved in cell wall biosynthesis